MMAGPSARAWFVTGTGTGVGKTTVAVALLEQAKQRGLKTAAMKPVETGCPLGPGGLSPADGIRLKSAATTERDLRIVSPFRYQKPAAPVVAARLEGPEVDIDRIRYCFEMIKAERPDFLLVEGAGGLLVPLTERHTMADLIVALGLPALVVARDGLGTINHTALTVEAALLRGIAVSGVILNGARAGTSADVVQSNAAEIERLVDVPVLGVLGHGGQWTHPMQWDLLS